MTISEKTEEVLRWTRQMNNLNLKSYMEDWVDHHSFITAKVQIEWYKATGRIPQPHNGGYWMSFETWRKTKKKILEL